VIAALVAVAAAAVQSAAQPATAAAPPDASATAAQPARAPATAQSATPPAKAHPFTVTVKVDKDELTLGEPFAVTVRVEHPALDVYALPEPLPVEPLTLRGAPSVSRATKGDRAETTFELPLVNVKTLQPRLPPLRLRVDGPEGDRELEVPETAIHVRSLVAEEHAADPEHAHHGPKPPVPVLVRSYLWAWIAGAAALLAAAFLVFREIRRRRALRPAPAPPLPSPEEEAMARLVALKQRRPWDRGLGRTAVFELSEILRAYLGRRLQFGALDLTTEELLAELRARKPFALDLADFSRDLSWQDLVKFAKAEPTPHECEAAIDRAASLIDRTRTAASIAPALEAV
jgi:hypothetical protein